jgi:hypothetical protein
MARVPYLGPTGGSSGRVPYLGPTGGTKPSGGGGGGFFGGIGGFAGNLAKDIGSTAVGVLPGLTVAGKAAGEDLLSTFTQPLHPKSEILHKVIEPAAKQEKAYYSHDVGHHLYTHPLQPILDALTVASLGTGAAAKIGLLSRERAALVTRSPRAAATGKGPRQTEITSTAPFVRGRQRAVHAVRTKFPEAKVGGELKQYGKGIQSRAIQHAMENLGPLQPYVQATRRLSPNEWAALHVRATDVHPSDLAEFWKGTPNEKVITDPKVVNLALNPSKRMLAAEPQLRGLSREGEALMVKERRLNPDLADARPGLTKRQVSESLGRPAKEITGQPYYFPHTLEPVKPSSPLAATGGGKGVPRVPGTMKRSTGALSLYGNMHLRGDVLGPEFLRRVVHVKYNEIHNALRRGAVRATGEEIRQRWGGKLPPGWEYVRQNASTRIPPTLRGEGTERIPLDQLVPNAEDLHNSALSEGFTTPNQAEAHTSGGRYYVVPKTTSRAATGEFTRSSGAVRNFVKKPLTVWRAAVLGLRPGFLTNNLVGNSLMYAAKTGGQGGLRSLFHAIYETHGPRVAQKALDNAATPPKLRADLTKEFFPEQVRGTFGLTQSPATSATHIAAGRKVAETGRTITGAIPRLTSKVAEEYPRRALVHHYIRHSPEFRNVYQSLPKQTRSFEQAARQVLEGKGGADYQRFISKQVNQALGDYLNLSPVERGVLRNLLPFYSWYRAIATTTYHLAADTPLRANILGQIGRIGREYSDKELGAVPSFLKGAIGLGAGPQGTERVLATQGLNPYATLEQLRRGGLSDYSQLGLNPFLAGPAQYLQRHRGPVSPASLFASPMKDLLANLPPSRLLVPPGPSKLYPTRKGRKTQLFGFAGVPIKEYSPTVAAQQAKQGR